MEVLCWDIPSRFRWLGVIDAALQEIGQELDWDSEDLNKIAIALIEAVSNAIEHGNEFESGQRVRVEAHLSSERLNFTVSDEGRGFDRTLLTVPPIPPDDPRFLNSRGRGIFIMRDIMDKVETDQDADGRFRVKLEKRIKSSEIAD